MKTSEVLSRARELIAGGWHEPFTLDAAGKLCTHDDEGAARFCLLDALLLAAKGDVLDETFAESAVERQLQLVEPEVGLFAWLEAEERKHADVLRLLARAEAHAIAGEE